MKHKQTKEYKAQILHVLAHPTFGNLCASDYQYIDDIAITCLVTPSEKWTSFMRDLDELITNETLILCGNQVKLAS